MNLVLIGYRGTGKSTVGALLAKQLGMRYVCMDKEIVKRAGMSIPEIVAKYDWKKFRDIESEVVRDLTGLDRLVIDTGGGVIERPENVGQLQANARLFWLKASIDTIVERIQAGTERPPLTEGKSFTEEVADVLAKRTLIYKRAAHYEIDTDNVTPQQVAEDILEIWKRNQ